MLIAVAGMQPKFRLAATNCASIIDSLQMSKTE